MTLFLASVTGAQEAASAVAGGADIIDLKDASRGALGAVEADEVRAAVASVAGRRPVSAVTGDLPMVPEQVVAAVMAKADTGVDYVKVGLFPDPAREDCIRALSPLTGRVKLVGVMFADLGADEALIPVMAQSGFAGAMLDTARKGAGRLLDHMDIPSLESFVAACRTHGLMAGLAGSLETPDIPRLLLLRPDFLGFRGALCNGRQRTAGLDAAAIDTVRGLIPADPRGGAPVAKVDHRLLAARGYSAVPTPDDPTDRVFVHDLILPVRIGIYAHEHEEPQRVRFNVDVDVRRPDGVPADMRDVFSYDVITDAIRMLVAQRHFDLVETLAERIATQLLAQDRVVKVRVRIEKIDLESGGAGVEIARDKPVEVAKIHQLYPAAARAGGDPKAGV